MAFLVVLHACFYLNFFFATNLIYKRIKDLDVVTGLIATVSFILVGSTALHFVRRWNYRVFYFIHVLLATVLLPVLYFHVSHIRLFIWETFAVYTLHSTLRYFSTSAYHGRLSIVSDTNLVHIRIPLSATDSAKSWIAGQHVYLRLPAHPSTPSNLFKALKERIHTNPFTVTSLPCKDRELVLVARTLAGNTKQLAGLALSLSAQSEVEGKQSHPLLYLEGPYGASSWLLDLSTYDHVLLVAGGVGATFIVPVWRQALEVHARKSPGLGSMGRVRLIWAVRSMADAKWAFPFLKGRQEHANEQAPNAGVELYVTSTGASGSLEASRSLAMDDANRDIATTEQHCLLERGHGHTEKLQGVIARTGRPNLRTIVDESFADTAGRTAVLICGPQSMVHELRKATRRWVKNGKDVYWHAETFAS